MPTDDKITEHGRSNGDNQLWVIFRRSDTILNLKSVGEFSVFFFVVCVLSLVWDSC